MGFPADEVRRSYDRLAAPYAERLFGELAGKPLDRALLACFAEQVRGLGPVADVGCGPGHVARHLHETGLPVLGLDLSPGMVALARRLTPEVSFHEGDMLALEAEDGAWGGIVAFYAIIHLPADDVPRALREFRRVLRPGGMLLLAVHAGREVVHRDELWGEAVSLDFRFFEPAELERLVEEAGFAVEARIERAPYPEVEYPSRRAYLLARKPAADG
jgi:SAM-dependent methyltransferase